jgi:hypothetical protein
MLMLVGVAASARGADNVGSISQLKGTVELKRGNNQSIATVAMPVILNDQFTTMPASSMTLGLLGGGSIEVDESTTFTIDRHLVPATSIFSTLVSMASGSVHSVVGGAATPTNFEVHTPNAVAAVRGTDFVVKFSQGVARPGFGDCGTFTDVAVYTGVVAVNNPAVPNVVVPVEEGYATTVACLHAPLNPGPVGIAGAGAGLSPAAAAPPPGCPPCSMIGGQMH